jgi:hypothetical protein
MPIGIYFSARVSFFLLFILYRDCNGSGAAYDPNISLGIYDANGTLVFNETVPFPGSTVLPIDINDPCTIPPQNICIEKAIYTKDLTLSPLAGGYHLAYQRCCRAGGINNLGNASNEGITITSFIPGPVSGFNLNSSSRL